MVLRAYVYSSDFINRRDNWSTYTDDVDKDRKEEICLRLQFFIVERRRYNEMIAETFYQKLLERAFAIVIRDIKEVIASNKKTEPSQTF